MVKFDKFNGPTEFNSCFPIRPVETKWASDGIVYSRRQLPLTLAHCITVHKTQGLTLDKVKVDIGKSEFSSG